VLTIDASVLVAASLEAEAGSDEATDFLRAVGRLAQPIHEPSLAIVEIAAGIARRTDRRDLVAEAVRLLLAMPGIVIHPLDMEAAVLTATRAADLGLRAGDAVYASVAREAGSTLVTLDAELRTRVAAVAEACTPREWLERQGA
jgi:predicted nucleic acid-binding protein